MNIELNKEETNALVGLIDMAVKAGGLQVANAALVLMKKIDDAAKAADQKDRE